ncbi:MAG: hypothetical protein U0U70_14435 [Chitinophagaceae bacterium]
MTPGQKFRAGRNAGKTSPEKVTDIEGDMVTLEEAKIQTKEEGKECIRKGNRLNGG